MRFNLRIKLKNITFFTMISKTQTLEGMSSLQPDGSHIVMWDCENCSLEEAEATLRKAQKKYRLSNIYIVSDVEGSYRAWCFSKVQFETFLKILVDCLNVLDYNFFYYTVKRKKATLRTCSKKGRHVQRVLNVMESYFVPIPELCEKVTYDTGLRKRGTSLVLGDD